MELIDAKNLILDKMKLQRPTLKQYLRSRIIGESKSSRLWNEAHPGCPMSVWRAGSAYAYRDIERMIEQDGFNT